MKDSLGLSICIVSWRAKDYLRSCLLSLKRNPPKVASFEILVADNNSQDGTTEMLRQDFYSVKFFANDSNIGYAAANNQLINASEGEFILLLNPDVEVLPDSIDQLLSHVRAENEVGAAAPRLQNFDGSLQRSVRTFPTPGVIAWEFLGLSRIFPRSKVFGKYRLGWWNYDEEMEVDQPMASALLLRRSVLEEVGSFDEAFPLYFNDVDLCYRLKEKGWKIIFEPRAKMIHHLGASTRQVRLRAVRESHLSLLRFYAKHYRERMNPLSYQCCRFLIWISQFPRMFYAILKTSLPPM